MKNTKWIKRAALFVAIVMCGFFGGIAFTGHLNLQKAAAAESVLAQDTALTSDQLESPFKAAYEKASQSVVGIKICRPFHHGLHLFQVLHPDVEDSVDGICAYGDSVYILFVDVNQDFLIWFCRF